MCVCLTLVHFYLVRVSVRHVYIHLSTSHAHVQSAAGEAGLGKSTLINSMFVADLYCNDYVGPSQRVQKTVKVSSAATARSCQESHAHQGAVLLTVGRSYVGNYVARSTLLDRACACSYKNLPKYRSYRISNTAPWPLSADSFHV